MARTSTASLKEKRLKQERISMLTAYDYSTAMLVDEAGIDMILVGDSLGMVFLGYENTLSVTMDDMIHHTKAVVRGTRNAMVVEICRFCPIIYPSPKRCATLAGLYRKPVLRP